MTDYLAVDGLQKRFVSHNRTSSVMWHSPCARENLLR